MQLLKTEPCFKFWDIWPSLLLSHMPTSPPLPSWREILKEQSNLPHLLLCRRSVVSDSLRPHGLPHVRLPCPSPALRVCSNSCPLCWWCHPTNSSLSSSSPPAFSLSQHQGLHIWWLKYWSFSISLSNEYSGLISFRMDWLDLLAVQGILKSLLQHTVQKHKFFGIQPSLWSNSHIHTWLLEKP